MSFSPFEKFTLKVFVMCDNFKIGCFSKQIACSCCCILGTGAWDQGESQAEPQGTETTVSAAPCRAAIIFLATPVHLPSRLCGQDGDRSRDHQEIAMKRMWFWLVVCSICSLLVHSWLQVNLNQGRFSLLDSGHGFVSKEIKAIQAYTCHITRKIPRVPFSLQICSF